MTKAVFQLEPLTCPSCIKKIETVLRKTAGVKEIMVLFHANKVKAVYDEKLVQASVLSDKIQKLGYPVTSQKVS